MSPSSGRPLLFSLQNLVQGLRRFLAPPTFADENKTLAASLLNTLLLAISGIWGVVTLLQIGLGVANLRNSWLDAVAIIVCLGLRQWLRSGRVALVAVLLNLMLMVVLALQIYNVGTIRTIILSALFTNVVVATFIFGPRLGLLFAGLNIALVFGLAQLELAGAMPPLAVPTPAALNQWTIFTALTLFYWALLGVAQTNMMGAIKRARTEVAERQRAEATVETSAAALAEANAKLRDINALLEGRVVERTTELTTANTQLSHEVFERAKAEATLRRQNQYLEALHQTALGLLERRDVETLLYDIVARAMALVGVPHGYLYLYDRERNKLVMRVGIGEWSNRSTSAEPPYGEGVARRVWATQQPLVINDYATWSGHRPAWNQVQLLALMGVPLLREAEVLGVIGLGRFEPGVVFDTEAMSNLEQFAQLAALALDNANLAALQVKMEAERRSTEQRQRLLGFNHELQASRDWESALETIQRAIASAIPHDNFGPYWLDEAAQLLRPVETKKQSWFSQPAVSDWTISLGQGILGNAALHQQAVCVNEAHLDPRSIYPPGEQAHLPREHLMALPLRGREKILGMLAINRVAQRPFTEEEFEMAQVFVQQAALALENVQLFADLEHRVDERTAALATANERLHTQHALARLLAEAEPNAEVLPQVLQVLAQNLHWDLALLWRVTPAPQKMRCAHFWAAPDLVDPILFGVRLASLALGPKEGLEGHVWASAMPLWIADIPQAELFQETSQALQLPLQSALAFPVVGGGDVLGVVTLLNRTARAPDTELLQTLAALGQQLGQFLERQQAQQQLQLHAAALTAAGDAIAITDRAGLIQWINPAFTHLTGYSAAEVIGRNPRFLKSGQQDVVFYRRMWQTILNGESWRGEFINRRKNGELYIEEQIITPVQNAQGEVTHFIGIKQNITTRKEAEDNLRRQNAYLEALHQTSLALLNRTGARDLLTRIVTHAAALVNATYGFMFLVEGDMFVLRAATHNFAINIGNREPLPGTGVLGQVWQTLEPVVIEDYGEWDAHDPNYKSWDIRAIAGAPIVAGGIGLGVLEVARVRDDERIFSPEERETLNRFAALASLALDNAQLLTQVRQRADELEILNRVGQALVSQVAPARLIELVGEQLQQAMHPPILSIATYDRAAGLIRFPFYRKRGQQRQQLEPIPYGQGISSRVLAAGAPLLLHTAQAIADHGAVTLGEARLTQSYLGTPIVIGGEAVGVISVQSADQEHAFSESDLQLLTTIAASVSAGLHNAQLYEALAEARAQLDNLLHRFLPEAVADQMIANPNTVQLGGERREVSLLFADIRGYTALAETLEPEAVMELLNQHYTAIGDLVMAHNGMITQFAGDMIMAVFNALGTQPDHAWQAVQAGLEIQQAMQVVAAKTEMLQPVQFGIGVNTGVAVVGCVGFEERFDFTAIGDATNVAARLCAQAAGGQVLLSAQTANAVQGRVPTRLLGPMTLKGKREPLLVYEGLANAE